MFCFHCGIPVHAVARFCSDCGTPLAKSPTTPSAGMLPISPISPPLPSPSIPASSPTALFNHAGQPQPAFERLASTVFTALDHSIKPRNTGRLEVSKMMAYAGLCSGHEAHPSYGSHAIPTYASIAGIELVPNQPKDDPIITWNGWRQLLLHKIQLDPETAFHHLARLLTAISIPVTFSRNDFPVIPSQVAQTNESQYRMQINFLAQQGKAMSRSWKAKGFPEGGGGSPMGSPLGSPLGNFGTGAVIVKKEVSSPVGTPSQPNSLAQNTILWAS